MSITNDERIDRAKEALAVASYGNGSTECDAVDLLADLMHLAKASKLDFNQLVKRAQTHFEAES